MTDTNQIPDYTKELKDYANKLWDEPTIYDPGEVINKLLTMIGKIPDPEAARYHQEPVERFKKPTDEQIVKAALLFNGGKLDQEELTNMVGMCMFVIDRLYENGDILTPSSKEKE